MRICPTCRTRYTDDTLRFCLQDGATLVERLESETPTVAFKEQETIEASRKTSSGSDITTSPNEEVTKVGARTHEGGRTGLVWALIAVTAVLATVVVAGAIGIAIFLKDGSTVSNSNNANTNTNGGLFGSSGTSTPTPTPSPSVALSTPSPSPTRAPNTDIENARREVSQTIYGWKSLAEAQDLNSYMENYADTVDYYNKSGASRSFVRNDKSRAFTMYDSIRTDVSNMNVSVDESGNIATATFDKEWDFRGSRNSSGKVQSQLKLRNVNGRWLIVGERDLKVYYTR
jgi:ketosteroid isomerase-like protein